MENDLQPQETTAEKKAYSTPSLVNYGKIQDLTTGGTGSKNENHGHPNGSPGPNQPPRP